MRFVLLLIQRDDVNDDYCHPPHKAAMERICTISMVGKDGFAGRQSIEKKTNNENFYKIN